MTVDELTGSVATELGITKKMAREVIAKASEKIAQAIEGGDQILLPNLGRFASKSRKARKGSNPTTKEPVTIPARVVPTFSFISKVKENVAKLEVEA